MKIHKVWAKNCAKVKDESVSFESSGNTFIFGDNEVGKSTLARIPFYLVMYPMNKASEIIGISPVSEDVATTLGMIFSVSRVVDGVRITEEFEFSQTYFRDEGALLIPREPKGETKKNREAYREFISILERSEIDLTLLKMLQVAQGKSEALFGKPSTRVNDPDPYSMTYLQKSSGLSRLLDNVAGGGQSTIEEPFIKYLEAEYLKYFTKKGGETAAEGTLGREIMNIEEGIEACRSEIVRAETDMRQREVESVPKQRPDESFADLSRMKEFQELQSEEHRLNSLLNRAKSLRKELSDLNCTLADISFYDSGDFETLQKLNPIFLASKSTLKAKIKTISSSSTAVLIDGKAITQPAEIPLLAGSVISIPDVVEIEVIAPEGSKAPRADQLERYNEILAHHKITDFDVASEMNDRAQKHKTLESEIQRLFQDIGEASLVSRLEEITKLASASPELWEKASVRQSAITQAELDRAREPELKQASYLEWVSNSGLPQLIERKKEEIEEKEQALRKLQVERNSIKLLWETINSSRTREVKNYSAKFAKELNSVTEEFFGPGYAFNVAEDFTITHRSGPEGYIERDQISTGGREQVALLVRIALARLAAPFGGLPLILDDEFAHSDETRIEKFRQLLGKLEEQQVLIFSCYPKKFESWPGKRITLAGSTV